MPALHVRIQCMYKLISITFASWHIDISTNIYLYTDYNHWLFISFVYKLDSELLKVGFHFVNFGKFKQNSLNIPDGYQSKIQ